MNPDAEIGIIEIGDKNLKCIIFKLNNESHEILSTYIVKSEGIINGIVVNSKRASNAIRSCIGGAEEKAKILLKKINVVLEQPEFLCTKFSKERKIDGSQIHKDDIDFLLKEAKKQVTLNDEKQSIIHIFNHNYIVDGKIFVEEPIDVHADYLSHEMTFITMPKNNIKNIKHVFNNCDLEIERFISSTFSLSVNLLNNYDIKFGSTLIDIGFERTSLGLFKNFALIHSITFPIGINHITKDISKVCSLTLNESNIIKNSIDFSFNDNSKVFCKEGYLRKDFFSNSNFRKISQDLLLKVIKERINEILKITKKQIELMGSSLIFSKKIFITGGGSNILNLEKYCSKVFDSDVKKLEINSSYVGEKKIDPNFNACLGALKIIVDGWETEAIPKTGEKYGQKAPFFMRFFT
jgi:cell division protein FtsA